jgi:hypothetical protein
MNAIVSYDAVACVVFGRKDCTLYCSFLRNVTECCVIQIVVTMDQSTSYSFPF